MTIVCLGWGSLIWKPASLPVRGEWKDDGPALPLEFARQSKDGRVTLAITSAARTSRTLWCEMDSSDIKAAARSLATREETSLKRIGTWTPHVGGSDEHAGTVGSWARARWLTGVVWTALPPRWAGEDGRVPLLRELVDYLRGLAPATLILAAEYIRKAPAQVETNYRAALLETLKTLGV